MGITAFISYATKDSIKFQVSKVAEKLNQYPEIDDVLYWEEDMDDDIIKYMNDNINNCNIFILFCSQNALTSEPVEAEWQTAFKLKKKIIPIFIDQSHIPPLISTKLGVQFVESDIEKTTETIYKLILKKLDYSASYQEKIAEELEIDSKEIINFRGTQIPQVEAKILRELEDLIKIQFTLVHNVKLNDKVKFSATNSKVVGISMFNCGITTLPNSFSKLRALERLYLNRNKLLNLPESIGELNSLIHLDLHENELETLPESFGNLSSLRELRLHNNQIWKLPESIGKLTTLQKLYLHNNNLTTLPETIGNLKSLQRLNLRSNKITSLPESVSQLKSLQILQLGGNQLKSFPESLRILEERGVEVFR